MTYTTASIGQLVKSTRKSLGVTQESLALASGTGLRFISDLEHGKPTCHVGKVLDVLGTLGIHVTLTPPDGVASQGQGK